MRTATAAELALLQMGQRAAHGRLWVQRSGTWVNLSDLEGIDWVVELQFKDHVDKPTATFRAKLEKAQFLLNLSPFMDASKLNAAGALLDLRHAVRIEAAVTPLDVLPASADWKKIFEGAIDKIDWNKPQIQVSGRDKGGALLDLWIETQRAYGSASGVRVEIVMQDILDDNNEGFDNLTINYTWNGTTTVTTPDTSEVAVGDYIGLSAAPFFKIASIVPNTSVTVTNPNGVTIPTGGGAGSTVLVPGDDRVTLYTENGTAADPLYRNGGSWDDSPDWLVKPFKQAKKKLLLALQDLALQIGWKVKYRWQADSDDFELVFWEPDRAKSTPDAEFSQSLIKATNKLSLAINDIRNKVRVTYGVADDRTTTSQEDAASIDKYGLRAMDIAEDSSSQIDSLTEADALASAAMNDLAEPTAIAEFAVPLFWPVETDDLYRWLANNREFDTDQDLAVVGISHVLSNRRAKVSTIEVRGKPSGGRMRWLEIEGLPGIAPEPDHYTDAAAEGAVATAGVGTVIVTYDDPRTMEPPVPDWAYTKCYVDTSSGFTPSAANLKAVGRQTRFEINGLEPGETYYVKLQIVDDAGNVASTSTVVSVATQQVGPYHINPEEQRNFVNYNPNFGIHTLDETTDPPDAWLPYASDSIWSDVAGEWYFETGAAATRTGDRAIKMNALSRPAGATEWRSFFSELFLVDSEALYVVNFEWKHDGNGGSDDRVSWEPMARCYTEGKVAVGSMSWTELAMTGYLDGLGYQAAGAGVVIAKDTWITDRGFFATPAGSKYARVMIRVGVSSGFTFATHPKLYIDRMSVARANTKFFMDDNAATNRSHTGNTWLAPWLANAGKDQWSWHTSDAWTPGNSGTAQEHEYEIQEDGQYMILGHVTWSAMTIGTVLAARIREVSGTATTLFETSPRSYPGGVASISVFVAAMDLQKGDVLRIEGYHNDGSAQTLNDPDCKLEVIKTSDLGIR